MVKCRICSSGLNLNNVSICKNCDEKLSNKVVKERNKNKKLKKRAEGKVKCKGCEDWEECPYDYKFEECRIAFLESELQNQCGDCDKRIFHDFVSQLLKDNVMEKDGKYEMKSDLNDFLTEIFEHIENINIK
jgi:hypothetical protein